MGDARKGTQGRRRTVGLVAMVLCALVASACGTTVPLDANGQPLAGAAPGAQVAGGTGLVGSESADGRGVPGAGGDSTTAGGATATGLSGGASGTGGPVAGTASTGGAGTTAGGGGPAAGGATPGLSAD